MQQIEYATKEDSAKLKPVMEKVVQVSAQKDWYIAEDIDFLEQHIEKEG